MTDPNPGPPEPSETEAPDRLLEDLDLTGQAGVDVAGGIRSIATGAPGVRPGGNLWGGAGRLAEKPSERVLNRIAEDDRKPKPKAKVIVDTRWLVPDPKQPGKWRRAEVGIEREKLGLEVSVNAAHAPDGTAAKFDIFQQGRSGDDALLASVEATIEGGAARAEWTCAVNLPSEAEYLEPKLYFKVAVRDDTARAVLIAVESWVELTVETEQDQPRDCAFIVKLPHGREKRGKTEKGFARFTTPPGNIEIRLAE